MQHIIKSAVKACICILYTAVHAGNGSAGWGAFGGALGGSVLGNVISQPRTTRTEIVQVPVQQAAPAPVRQQDDSDDAALVRKLRRENKTLVQEVEELADDVMELKKEVKKLKAENLRLKENQAKHTGPHAAKTACAA